MKVRGIVVTYKGELVFKLANWSKDHFVGLFLFNGIILLLVLLSNAGYFSPFFPITINVIVLASLILAVILLGVSSRVIFLISLIFLIIALIFLFLDIRVWSERTMIYVFQSYVLGVVLLFIESCGSIKKKQ